MKHSETMKNTPPLSKNNDDSEKLLGDRLSQIRHERKLSLSQVSALTGISQATLSRVENYQSSLNYQSLIHLARGLDIDIVELFNPNPIELKKGRFSITKKGQGLQRKSERFCSEALCTSLSKKAMVPSILTICSHSVEESGDLIGHLGEEFIYVLSGTVELHTEFYEPIILETHDCIYLDSTMAHAFVAAGNTDTELLSICTEGTETEIMRL